METQKPEVIPPEPGKNLIERIKHLLEKALRGIKALPLGKVKDLVKPLLKAAKGKLDLLAKIIEARLPEKFRPAFVKYQSKIFAGIGIILVLFALKSCAGTLMGGKKSKVSLEEAMAQKGPQQEAIIPVKGFKVGRFNFEDSLNALGTIKGAMEFKLSFEVPGTVSSINYREGERYEEGALLISLRQDDILLRLKRAQAEQKKAETQAKIKEETVNENDKLFKMGAVPKSTLENAKLEWDSAKFESEAARLEVKANEAMLEKSNLYAPSAGMISELNIEEGETITPNSMLGTHINTEYVYAEFGIVERDVNKIALGQKARVFIDAYPDKTFEGVIENVAPQIGGSSRTATARVRIENPERLLLPGMFARIRILLYSKKNTLVIPTDAVQGKEGEQFVYVVHSSKPKEEAKAEGKAPEEAAGPEQLLAGLGAQNAGAPEAEAPKNELKKEEEKPKAKPSKKKEKETEATEKKEEIVPDTVEKRAITVGYTRPDYTQIDAGVSEGEVVAISGLEKLGDGKKVRVLEVQEAEI